MAEPFQEIYFLNLFGVALSLAMTLGFASLLRGFRNADVYLRRGAFALFFLMVMVTLHFLIAIWQIQTHGVFWDFWVDASVFLIFIPIFVFSYIWFVAARRRN